jgi:large subunit ribosomal protein L13e
VGIAVDHRRTNKSAESLALNVQRLKDYQARLVIFTHPPSKEEIADAPQLKGAILPSAATSDAVTFTTISEVLNDLIWNLHSLH